MKEACANHPERKAENSCHSCGQFLCGDCLVEGNEYYYCRQEACQAEMVKRGDVLPPSESDEEEGSKVSLVTICTFSQPYQAELAKAHLEAEGIPAFLSDEYLVSINWLYSNAVGGVRLKVAEPDVEAARKILSVDLSDDVQDADSGEDSEST